MQQTTLTITGAPNIRFKGELIASSKSSWDRCHPNYSGTTGIAITLRLYRTATGKYVCHIARHTQWQGESDVFSGAVCESEAEVIEFFGQGWQAREVYDEAEIDNVIDID